MIAAFIFATFMVGLTVTIHFFGLMGLLWLLRLRSHRLRAAESWLPQGAAILFVVLGLMVIHAVEIWLYAGAFMLAHVLPDFETALYFSTVSFTTLGYGDVVLDKGWRLLGAIEGANGVLLFGWSTAFLFSVTTRMRAFEHDRLDRDERR